MKVEKIETVTVTNEDGKPIMPGDEIVILFNNDNADVFGIFVGLGARNTVGVSCHNGTHWFKQTTIEDIKVFE